MPKWGSCEYHQLQKLRKNLAKLEDADLERFCRDVSRELAARLLALVIPRTPVGDYSKEVTVTTQRDSRNHKKGETYTKRVTPSGKKGGTLRRGWTARTEQEAAGGSGSGQSGAKAYAGSLPIKKQGGGYTVEVLNPVHYASYVEFGHRTPGGRDWVNGQYFLTLSEQELRSLAPAFLERRLAALLQEVFRV